MNYACALQSSDDAIDWVLIKPNIFATVMDFFASNVPIFTDEVPRSDTGVCLLSLEDMYE